jgi:hypothetical protein
MAQRLDQPPWATSGYLTEDEAANYIRTPQETLRKWRRLGVGPVAVKQPNGRIFYPVHLLDAWKAELIEQAVADAAEREPGPGRGRPRRRAIAVNRDGLQAVSA